MTISIKRKQKRELRHLLHPKASGAHLRNPDKKLATSASWKAGQSGNPAGRPAGLTFSSILRDTLTKKRKYRTKKGLVFESSELELIVSRAVKELRTNPEFDVRLLETLINRLEGRVKEPIDVEGIKELASDLSAREILSTRFGGLILARGNSEGNIDALN